MRFKEYDRAAAVEYAHRWAYLRNPRYYNFESLGGDCTNFASQCLFAGCGVMNYERVKGWFYVSLNSRSPSFSGVEFLYSFLVKNESVGPFGREVGIEEVMPGDIAQLRFGGAVFGHSPIIVEVGGTSPSEILVAAHTFDVDNKPLSGYFYEEVRFIHIDGARVW